MGEVVQLFKVKDKDDKKQTKKAEFAEVAAKNKANAERVAAERKQNNKNVIKSNILK